MTSGPQHIESRDNAFLKELRRLAQDSTAYRKQERVWLEGDHLCRAALQRGLQPSHAVFQASYWDASGHQWARAGGKAVVIEDTLFAGISGLESPARMGFVLPLPAAPALQGGAPTVVLDGLQDAGNVGTILRSAAAFGLRQVLAMKGTAALWSPKVLRAGMGAHFGLSLLEGLEPDALAALKVPLLATSSHQGSYLHQATLPWPCAWVFGHEGQGVSAALSARAAQHVRIVQPGGEESLNVGAAAAICLHASASALPEG
jgi:TrmH family RNA methyltransferase